ncbi:hypothetical protein [Sciscionella marina]|nr:hypothetical protein [Sciscionella marina]
MALICRRRSGGDQRARESTIGLFKTEVVNRHGPFKTLTDTEYALME